MKKTLLSIASVITLSQAASAHSSGHHEGFVETAQHLISQPDHLVMLGLAVLLSGLIFVGAHALSKKTK
ncbi:MAG TPA: hypothetical protein DCX06_13480 [Opitutae bacterium]|nr:hypothetical protein [Opitutae bacterium]